ncbi:MAG: DNA polymerase III subunit gamma/tau [Oscillospiraceae bacterium]|nr:DNA polymerase III subunit gamma/tau [Oscillospiraceae bacterium]
MYQALYRKYRPRSFSDVAGQEHVTDTLRRQIMSNRLSHAYLFVGTRGTGKTSCAKVLARAMNCENPIDGDPCNKCASCIGIENGSILDVLELDAASNNGVDNIRSLRDDAIYSPASVKKRVYILDEVHMLSTSASNALLKILEEPPEHLIFILATTELHKVPATILSRCQRFSFKRISPDAIIERLQLIAKNEQLSLTDDAAEKLASLADGSLRDAISLLDQCAIDTTIDLQRVLDTVGLVGKQDIVSLAEAAAAENIAAALDVLDNIYSGGRDMASLLGELASLYRDVLVFKLSPGSPLLSGGFSRAELSPLSAKLTPEMLFSYLDVIREATYSISHGMGVRITVEMCILRICDRRLSDNPAAMLSRIAALEGSAGHSTPAPHILPSVPEPPHEPSAESAPPAKPAMPTEPESAAEAAPTEPASAATLTEPASASEAAAPEPTSAPEAATTEAAPTEHESATEATLTEPASAPEAAAPEPASATAAPTAEKPAFWSSILDQLKTDMSIYSLLSDDSRVQAEMRDNGLVIHVGDAFTAGLIESKKFAVPLAEASSTVFGKAVKIRVEIMADNASNAGSDKLDNLIANFGSIIKG